MATIEYTNTTGESILTSTNLAGYGNRSDSYFIQNDEITEIKFWVKRVGTPSGGVIAHILDSSKNNGSPDKVFGSSINVATISTSEGWITFSDTWTVPNLGGLDLRFVAYFTGTYDISNHIAVYQNTPNPLYPSLYRTAAIGATSFNDVTTYILLTRITYNPVTPPNPWGSGYTFGYVTG